MVAIKVQVPTDRNVYINKFQQHFLFFFLVVKLTSKRLYRDNIIHTHASMQCDHLSSINCDQPYTRECEKSLKNVVYERIFI